MNISDIADLQRSFPVFCNNALIYSQRIWKSQIKDKKMKLIFFKIYQIENVDAPMSSARECAFLYKLKHICILCWYFRQKHMYLVIILCENVELGSIVAMMTSNSLATFPLLFRGLISYPYEISFVWQM